MTVERLIELLQKFPGDMLVVMARGNTEHAAPVSKVLHMMYVPHRFMLAFVVSIKQDDDLGFGPMAREAVVLRPEW